MSTDALRLPSRNPQHQMWREAPVTRILGVDPGTNGGLAIIVVDGTAPVLADCVDVPVTSEGAKKRIDAIAICEWVSKRNIQHVYIERAQALPGQGASNGFNYGRAVGSIEAAIALCGIPITVVEPAARKKFYRLRGRDTEPSRQRATQLFLGAHKFLFRKRHHHRANAALIALFGARSLPSAEQAA